MISWEQTLEPRRQMPDLAERRRIAVLILINKIAGPTGRSCTKPKQNNLLRDFVERLERAGVGNLEFHFDMISPEARDAIEEARKLGFVEEVSSYSDFFFQDYRLLDQQVKEAELSGTFTAAEIEKIRAVARETSIAFMGRKVGDREAESTA